MIGKPWARRQISRIARMLGMSPKSEAPASSPEWVTLSIRIPAARAAWYREAIKSLTVPEACGKDGVGVICVGYTAQSAKGEAVIVTSIIGLPGDYGGPFSGRHAISASSLFGACSGSLSSRLASFVASNAASGIDSDRMICAYSEGWKLGQATHHGVGGSVDLAHSNLPPSILRLMMDPPEPPAAKGGG